MSGRVFWITGLSGSGKTTVAQQLQGRMQRENMTPLLLDGDTLRSIFADASGHGKDARHALAMRYARLCAEIAAQGIDVICATISMFHDVRAWNREHIPRYCEIYLKVPLAELERRDSKSIYSRARKGELSDVVGVDLTLEEPQAPDIVIENHADLTAENACETIWRQCLKP